MTYWNMFRFHLFCMQKRIIVVAKLNCQDFHQRVLGYGIQAFQLHGHLYSFIFLVYFGDMFFSLFSIIWGHSVAASCWSWSEFQWPKWSRSLILLFPQDNRSFGISGINLCHLGAELSILRWRNLRWRKRFRGSITTFKKNYFWC
jgi:hypothetical protein